MFDLFRSRAKAVRYVLGGLMVMVAASMVITLIPGFGSGGGSREQDVAEIGREAVTSHDVLLYVQRVMKNRQIPATLLPVFIPQIVDQMINERALVYAARQMGFEVTPADLSEAIQQIFPQLFQDGKFIGQEAYATVLAQQNLSIPDFERLVENDMLRAHEHPGQQRRDCYPRGDRTGLPAEGREGQAGVPGRRSRQAAGAGEGL